MSAVAVQPHVTLSGDITGRYLVTDQSPNGELRLVPDSKDSYPTVTWADMRDPAARDMTAEEFNAFMAEHGPHMQPPDSEG